MGTQFLYTLSLTNILSDFHNCFVVRIRRKFVIILLSLKIPPHLKCVTTLPCEISSVLKSSSKRLAMSGVINQDIIDWAVWNSIQMHHYVCENGCNFEYELMETWLLDCLFNCFSMHWAFTCCKLMFSSSSFIVKKTMLYFLSKIAQLMCDSLH